MHLLKLQFIMFLIHVLEMYNFCVCLFHAVPSNDLAVIKTEN